MNCIKLAKNWCNLKKKTHKTTNKQKANQPMKQKTLRKPHQQVLNWALQQVQEKNSWAEEKHSEIMHHYPRESKTISRRTLPAFQLPQSLFSRKRQALTQCVPVNFHKRLHPRTRCTCRNQKDSNELSLGVIYADHSWSALLNYNRSENLERGNRKVCWYWNTPLFILFF